MICTKCGVDKTPEEFHFRNKAKGIRKRICATCCNQNGDQHYQKYKEYYIQKSRNRTERIRAENRKIVLDHLSTHPCVDCGEKDIVVLEFDHVRGTKFKNVSQLIQSAYVASSLIAEIEKCDIRCANCHRRKTSKGNNSYRILG